MNQHVTEKSTWGLAALFSKANKQSRLAERKVGFILDASNCGELGGGYLCKAVPTTNKQRVRAFIDLGWGSGWERGRGATCRNSAVSSVSHLQIGHQWSDWCHLILSTVNLPFQGQFVLAQGSFSCGMCDLVL